MPRGFRAELELLVQTLERRHPDWPSSRIEVELESLAPVAYGTWKEDTPLPRSRHRQIQRWRSGSTGGSSRLSAVLPFQFLWPVGERQRRSLDPGFPARITTQRASHRLFVRNCSGEIVRELRIRLEDHEVGYEPALEPGRFTEVHWVRNSAVRASLLRSSGHDQLRKELVIDFTYGKGWKQGRLQGVLFLDASDGWTGFAVRNGPTKEIE